jgi:hypothetical protein
VGVTPFGAIVREFTTGTELSNKIELSEKVQESEASEKQKAAQTHMPPGCAEDMTKAIKDKTI